MSNLQLFFTFIKGDHRTSLEYLKSRKGLPIKGLDHPLLRYTMSLADRIERLKIIFSKINETHVDALRETQNIYEGKLGYYMKGIELNIYYEAFLNEIYTIMENIARINVFMFDDSHDIPHSFMEQLKKIKKYKLSLHPKYNRLISEEMNWYIDVNTIRDNTVHYLTGIPIFDRSDGGTILLQHLSYNLSEREQHKDSEFKIKKDVLESAKEFFEKTMEILEKIAEIYIERMDKDVECQIIRFADNKLEVWALSYNNCIRGEKGKYIKRIA